MFSYIEIQERIPRLEDDPRDEDGKPLPLSVKRQADALGVSEGTIRRAMVGGLDPYKADRMAVKGLGLHPASVWSWDEWCLADDIQKDEDGNVLNDCDALRGTRQRKTA